MSDDDAEIIDLPSGGMLTMPALEAARARQPRRDVIPPPSTSAGPLIVCESLVKIYKVADLEVVALQGLDLVVEQGEFIALVGA